MSIFIDTDKIEKTEDLLQALKENIVIARNLKKQITELKNIKFVEENSLIVKENSLSEKSDNPCIKDDFEYEYYYYPIKNIPIDATFNQIKSIIEDNLPSENNSNYFKLINRIKIEIYKEMSDLINMFSSCDDDSFKTEIKKCIDQEKLKLSLICEIEKTKKVQEEINTTNKLIFLRTKSDNVYALDDIKNIDSEYYLSFLELLLSIKDSTFKNAKRLTSINNKLNSISEVKGFKTRIIFDKIADNTYVILQCIIKKSDFDRGYKESLENRVSVYRKQREEIIKQLSSDDFMMENIDIENKVINKLNNNKKKVMK